MDTSSINGFQTVYNTISCLFQLIQTIVIVIGVPLLIQQIRKDREALKLQNESFRFSLYMQLMSESSHISEMVINIPELIDFYDQEKLPSDLSSDWNKLNEKYRKHYLYIGRFLSFEEQSFNLWCNGWIDEFDYRATLVTLNEIMSLKIFTLWWNNLQPYYRTDFVNYIDNLRGKDSSTFYKVGMIKRKIY